jgi:hypothetical protein
VASVCASWLQQFVIDYFSRSSTTSELFWAHHRPTRDAVFQRQGAETPWR